MPLSRHRGPHGGDSRSRAPSRQALFPSPRPTSSAKVGHRHSRPRDPVDLSKPALAIRIEVLTADAFFYFDKHAGAGGLPVGTSGKVMSLLSGGIDSPVAAWRLIRRGCRAHFVHFHSYPILSRASQEKVRELAEILTRHQLRSMARPRAARRRSAEDRRHRPSAAPGRDLPASHGAHCGAAGQAARRARARHRRLGRPGRVTDDRQPHGHRQRRDHADRPLGIPTRRSLAEAQRIGT
jgi:hypothetical protein